jgi:signal transduction histidine kinase
MLRKLRNRLIVSHILPLLIILPIMAAALVYILETRVLLPQLARNLVSDARLLSEISRSEYELWGSPYLFPAMLERVQLDPALRVMFLNPGGRLLYSSDDADTVLLGEWLDIPGLQLAQAGSEAALTNYSPFRLGDVYVDVLSPVNDPAGQVIGIVRVTYQLASIYELFSDFRLLILGVLVFSLLLGAFIGSGLAINIGRPVQQVTQAIYDLARGARQEALVEQGPEEMRDQIRAVNFLVERLQSLEKSRRQLLANLVHELGRPLGALRSAIHALSRGAAGDAQLLADLTAGMDEEAARLQRVVEDLAHLHDQVLGDLELNFETIQTRDWLGRVLAPWAEAAKEKNLDWQVEIQPDLPDIQADPDRLAQVIGNLVSNAVRYTPAGKSVSLSAEARADQLVICVRDSGPGINPDEQEKIFTPFYRGDQGRRIKQGMGLGLSIARDLVDAHGGTIELESSPGKGSQFTVLIPQVRS